jgi:hypothetical protein
MKKRALTIILILFCLTAGNAAELAGPPRAFSILAIRNLGLVPIACKGSLRKPPLGGTICARVKAQPRTFQQRWNSQSTILARKAGFRLVVQKDFQTWKKDSKNVFVRWYTLNGYDFTVFHAPLSALVEFQSDDAFQKFDTRENPNSTGTVEAVNRGYRCSDYPTHQDAQAAFKKFNIRALDRDRDGLACECNVGGPGVGKPQCR